MKDNLVITEKLMVGKIKKVKVGSILVQKYNPDQIYLDFNNKIVPRFGVGDYVIAHTDESSGILYQISEESEKQFIATKSDVGDPDALVTLKVYQFVPKESIYKATV